MHEYTCFLVLQSCLQESWPSTEMLCFLHAPLLSTTSSSLSLSWLPNRVRHSSTAHARSSSTSSSTASRGAAVDAAAVAAVLAATSSRRQRDRLLHSSSNRSEEAISGRRLRLSFTSAPRAAALLVHCLRYDSVVALLSNCRNELDKASKLC